ncbi:MAG: valine--tRNA ligase [Oligosphaeraceae bacterium]
MSEEPLSKAYSPAEVEAKWYAIWEKRGYFHGSVDSPRKPYTIVIPPPNVTGILTLGHVLNNTLQDILIRFEKMRGRETCWVPGMDHAGIATQAKVEAFLKKEKGLTRYDLGREKFLDEVWKWKEQYGGKIIRQLRTIGTACDWPRERFTFDEGLSNAVQEVFIRLYQDGLIYKGHRIINWCPKSRTALSDEEVIYRQESGHLWHIRYPFADGSGEVVVATTRPETLMGDTAVAVNPGDERYQGLVGKMLVLPIVNRQIPLIADDYVEKEFGTGAVKITPAHDPNDYEVGLRHHLEMPNIMNDDGTLNENAGAEFAGLDRSVARKLVVQKLEEAGLLVKTEDYVHQVGYSERGGVPVEPRLSEQWFVRMEPLAKPAIEAVTSGRIRFHPERWVKTYLHWMENIKDWCISRQLWWGHRIPAYYCKKCGKVFVGKAAPEKCPCGCTEFRQDEDVLDTWFSSWLWPFSVFSWPQETPELKHFYPTDTLVTGPDIIFFWVARMIMSGLRFMGEVPFKDVYFTSIIRDDKGRKLSKSLNNSPDPLDVVATYGADALRFTIIYIAPMGQDIRYDNKKCEIGRNFANKLWNVVRFRLQHGPASPDWQDLSGLKREELRPDDQWILARLNSIVRTMTRDLDTFDFNDATKAIYDFVWNEFCSWYLESAKPALSSPAGTTCATLKVFDYCLGTFLKLLHPIMPFVTDELYHQMGFCGEEDSIMLQAWPLPVEADRMEAWGATEEVERLNAAKYDLVRSVRNLRANYQISTTLPLDVVVTPAGEDARRFLDLDREALAALLNAKTLTLGAKPAGPAGVALSAMGTAFVPLEGLVDLEAEKKRLEKQSEEAAKYIATLEKKLSNQGYVQHAPAAAVEADRTHLAETRDKLARIKEQLGELQ